MSHLVRQQNQHQCRRKRQAQQQSRRIIQHPSHGKERNVVIVQGKSGLVVLEIVFHARAHHESSEDRRQQEDDVQPIALLRRRYNKHFYRTVIIRRGRRNWGKKFRHQDSTVR